MRICLALLVMGASLAMPRTGQAQAPSPPESLLFRGVRARQDSNYALAILLLDSAADSPRLPIRRNALFQAMVARFSLGRQALTRSERERSCTAAQEGAELFRQADSLAGVLRAIAPANCDDCYYSFPESLTAEASARVRRYCR